MLINGSCHCGNIRYELDWSPDPVEIPARACTCSFCVKHGGVWTSCPTGSLTVLYGDSRRVNKYHFGTKTADFHVCATCGVAPVVTSEIDGKIYAVVSVNAMDNVDSSMLKRGIISFDGEEIATRLQRRVRGWIQQVTIRTQSSA